MQQDFILKKLFLFTDLQVDARRLLSAIPKLGRLQAGGEGQALANRDFQSAGAHQQQQAEQTQIDRQGAGQNDHKEIAKMIRLFKATHTKKTGIWEDSKFEFQTAII